MAVLDLLVGESPLAALKRIHAPRFLGITPSRRAGALFHHAYAAIQTVQEGSYMYVDPNNQTFGLLICVLLFAAVLLYFVPSIIAVIRHHHNKLPIIVLNILLGWTFLGWVASLVWSLTSASPSYPQARPTV